MVSIQSFLTNYLKNYLNSKRGATAVEYGLIVAGITVLILGAVFAFGEEMQSLFERISDILNGE